MSRPALLAVLCSSLACGSSGPTGSGQAPPVGHAEPPPTEAHPDGPAAPAAQPGGRSNDAGATDSPRPGAEQRAGYRRHLRAGRKLAAASRWGEAARELDAALAAIPGDARALSELTWVLYRAGDHARARAVGLDAVKAASSSSLRAAGLYNLGRIEEAAGEREAAERHYKESLGLRDNKAVAARLAAIGKAVASSWEPWMDVPCRSPASLDAVCDCLVAEAKKEDPGSDPTCTDETEEDPDAPEEGDFDVPADVHVVRLAIPQNYQYFVVAALPGRDRWGVIGDLGWFYVGGVAGVEGSWTFAGAEESRVGPARVLRLDIEKGVRDLDYGVDEESFETRRLAVYCVLSGRKTGPACPLTVPLEVSYERDRAELRDESELGPDERQAQTKGLPIKRHLRVDVALAPDGTAQVVLREGRSSDDGDVKDALGPHRLW